MALTASSASSRRATFLLAYPRSKEIPVLYLPFKNVYMGIGPKSCVHTYQRTPPGRVIYKWFCRSFAYRRLSRSALGRTPPPSAVFKIIVIGIKKKTEPISDLENLVRIILVWCGRWDWILAARRRSVSAVLKPHWGLIHYGFFKSVSRVYKKEARHFRRAFFCGAGNRT